jgi:hypothetical protein
MNWEWGLAFGDEGRCFLFCTRLVEIRTNGRGWERTYGEESGQSYLFGLVKGILVELYGTEFAV